jgi:ribosomal protein L11 methyltransferase
MKDSFTLLHLTCSAELSELLIAILSEEGFDAFEEKEHGFTASIPTADFKLAAIESALTPYRAVGEFSYKTEEVAKVNWNEEWEKNYEPIEVADQVYIRASFHPKMPHFAHDILINPKMSFGTGHHATTHLMVKQQLGIDHHGKSVLDVGTGTGILAIMAAKLGATSVEGFDIDDWSVDNASENFALNHIEDYHLWQGTVAEEKSGKQYDIILANINRNVLLSEMSAYAERLANGGYLLLSGFYVADVADIRTAAEQEGLQFVATEEKETWATLVFIKP